jgi:predicted amino acid dehydrogenase
MLFHDKDVEHLQTVGGTPVAVGSGYSGTGPTGATGATASAINKWIYATGTVRVLLGKPDVVNDNLAQGYDVSGNQNDMKIKATRAASVYFDTSIYLAVRVDLTA